MSDRNVVLDRVATFASGPVAQDAPSWSLGASPDPSLHREAARLGLTGFTTPAAHGGLGQDFGMLIEVCEVLAAVDFGFAMSLVNTQNVGLRLCSSADARVRNKYLPGILAGQISACTALTEPGAGTDFAAITTRAHETSEGWRVTGEKTWIVNGRHAGLAVVYAQCAEQGRADGIAGLLVDLNQPGVRRYPIESGFPQGSMGTGGFVLHEVRAEAMLAPPGGAFRSILTEINAARTYVAAMCNAMLGATIAEAKAYGARRRSFGKTLNQFATWRQPLEAAEADLNAARLLTAEAVGHVVRAADAQLSAARAKIAAVEAAQRHIPQMLHAMGAEGLRPEHCFTRHLAAAQIAGFADGATSILRERVAHLTRAGSDLSKR